MNNIVEDHCENRFANGQSSRDLRATLCGAEQETQLMEAVDNVGTSLVSSRFQREWMQKNRGCFEMETSIQEYDDAAIDVVNARLNYLAEATPKPINYAYDPLCVPPRSGKYLEQNVAIRNGRKERSKFSLDTNGFLLTEHETAVKDFYDSDEVKSVYYPEVERLLKRVTGAERVVVFDHIVRNPVFAESGEKGARAPAKLVHNDYTFKSAPRRVRDLLPEEADRLDLIGNFDSSALPTWLLNDTNLLREHQSSPSLAPLLPAPRRTGSASRNGHRVEDLSYINIHRILENDRGNVQTC